MECNRDGEKWRKNRNERRAMARRLDLSPIGVSVGRESKAHEERGGVGLLLPAWFGVQRAGLGGGKAVDWAGEVKEMGTDSRPRRYQPSHWISKFAPSSVAASHVSFKGTVR